MDSVRYHRCRASEDSGDDLEYRQYNVDYRSDQRHEGYFSCPVHYE